MARADNPDSWESREAKSVGGDTSRSRHQVAYTELRGRYPNHSAKSRTFSAYAPAKRSIHDDRVSSLCSRGARSKRLHCGSGPETIRLVARMSPPHSSRPSV